MAKLLVYAKMCALVYKVPGIASLDSWGIAGERTTNSGFKGASFFSNDELVIAFAGTELKCGEAVADSYWARTVGAQHAATIAREARTFSSSSAPTPDSAFPRTSASS